MTHRSRRRSELVIRRVGGLEVPETHFLNGEDVIRRVGGLEGPAGTTPRQSRVIRRVGGLEVGTALHAATM